MFQATCISTADVVPAVTLIYVDLRCSTPAAAYRHVSARVQWNVLLNNALTWWLGKTNVSAITTFSGRVAAKTMTSAISSPINGSTPLEDSQNTTFTTVEPRHTHRRHQPWPCHRSIEQLKTPTCRSVTNAPQNIKDKKYSNW